MVEIFNISDFSKVVFGQYHFYNYKFFRKNFGDNCYNIPVTEFPHYKFLEEYQQKGEVSSTNSYVEYLSYAFSKPTGLPNTPEGIGLKQKEFIEFFKKVKKNPDLLLTTRLHNHAAGYYRKDGKISLVHGNHRIAIACFLGLPVRLKVVSKDEFKNVLQRYFDNRLSKNPNFFSGLQQPYQSVFDGEEEIAEGRRPDILERFKKINLKDIKNKRVIELGCNIGSSLCLALEQGAKYALGLEISRDMIDVGLKLNTYFAKNIDFEKVDLNDDIKLDQKFDTVFCLSVAGYVRDWKKLSNLILNTDLKVMYFEGHINKKVVDYVELFKHFSKIEFLGFNKDQRKTDTYTRPFFRCIK